LRKQIWNFLRLIYLFSVARVTTNTHRLPELPWVFFDLRTYVRNSNENKFSRQSTPQKLESPLRLSTPSYYLRVPFREPFTLCYKGPRVAGFVSIAFGKATYSITLCNSPNQSLSGALVENRRFILSTAGSSRTILLVPVFSSRITRMNPLVLVAHHLTTPVIG
jgi:hypothetical protein